MLFLTSAWQYSILEAGLAVSPGAVGAALVAPLAARAYERRGVCAAVVPGALLFAGVCLWVVLAIDTQPDFIGLWLPTGTLGGIALNQTGRQLGGALGVACLVALLSADAGLDGFLRGWTMCGLAGLVTALVATRLRPHPQMVARGGGEGAD